MRVNVYDHELTDRVEIATATADNTGQSFYGVRIYVGPTILHQPGDDDSAAVTWWVPWSRIAGHDVSLLRSAFEKALRAIDDIERMIAVEPDGPTELGEAVQDVIQVVEFDRVLDAPPVLR